MVEELKDPRLIETYVRNDNSEREWQAELAALQDAPIPISLHPATLDRYIETVKCAC
jgi:hypothetical protein